ncbi:MAG: hypothetical protein IPG58_09800 [Acidobacteria bacterium]|nr:hypothetical protein [Acidobacteriota bacterium]
MAEDGHRDAVGHERRRDHPRHPYRRISPALTSIPGVGRKTAERLVIELRDKIGELSSGGTAKHDALESSSLPSDAIFEDALSALVNLGYQRPLAKRR